MVSTNSRPSRTSWSGTFSMIPQWEKDQQDDLIRSPGSYDVDIVLLAPGWSIGIVAMYCFSR